jgi:molybdopterin-binding protein
VQIRLKGGTTVVASIARQSLKALESNAGGELSAILKASNALIGA